MRSLLLAATAVLVFAALPAAQAQDACTQSTPCPWDVVVDQPGFIGESSWNFTLGDWMSLNVSNDGEVAHTVTLDGHGVTLTIPSLEARAQSVHLTKAGSFLLRDKPSGDNVTVTVVNGDVVDYEKGIIDSNGNALTTGATSGKGRIPGLEAPLLALGLLAVALMARRSP